MFVPLIVSVPPVAACVNPVRVNSHVRASTSVSFERTDSERITSSVPLDVKRSLLAIGASLTHCIVSVPVCVLEARGQKVSVAWYVKESVPQ